MNDLPKGWILTEIGEISEYIQRGKSPKYIDKSDLPVINQKCIRWDGVDPTYLKFIHPDQWDSWTPERFLQSGDLLWNSTGTGTIGRAALFTELEGYERAVVDSHVTIVRCNTACHPYYLHYFIKSPFIQKRIEEMHTGSTNQVELSRSEVLRTSIPLPPLGEQGRIVEKLDELLGRSRRAREELQQIPKLIQRYKQAVLAAAFRGDLTADWRDKNKPDLSVNCPTLDNDQINNLSSLPEDWIWVTINQVAKVIGGLAKSHNRASLEKTVPYLRVANVYANELRLDEVLEIGISETEWKRVKLNSGDLLIVEGNGSIDQIGRVALWSGEIENCAHQNHLIKVRVGDLVFEKFALYWLLSPIGRLAIELVASSSSGLHTLSLSKVSALPLPLCSIPEQKEIVQRVEERFKAIETIEQNYQKAIALLDRLDQATLAKAFRGQLVPQDPNDEPASVLLERIRADRTQQPTPRKRKPKATQLSLDCPSASAGT
ncbi:MAG: hypothetical protein BJG00_016950 [Limnothrix sp. CACIAM 69d]|nr:MAG: hypothetical protein BJG00_016950 [Limnothrix sp. CACIAM 69d]